MDGRYDADGVNGGDLASVTRFLRRQWWVIALSTALALVAGIAALSLLPASYAANTVLLLKPISVADKERATLNMDTELQLAKSTLVAQDAAAAIGDAQTSGDVQRRLTLYVPANSTVMHLTFTAEDAQSARAGSQAVATSYLTAREESARKGVESQIAGLQSQRDQIASTADTVRTQLAGVSTGTPDGQRLLTDLDSALRRVAEIDAQIASLRTVSINPGEVITAAALPQSPASPNASKVLGSALILGLLAGLVLAALRQTVQNRKINSVEHLGSLSGVDRVADLQGLGGPAHKRGARTPRRRSSIGFLPGWRLPMLTPPASSW